MEATTLGALLTICGTILGYLLSELSAWVRARRQSRKEARAVRTLLRLEVDYNLKLLGEFRLRLNNIATERIASYSRPELVAKALTKLTRISPAPVWAADLWKTQTHLVSTALRENEILAVYEVYHQLHILSVTLDRARQEEVDPLQAHGFEEILNGLLAAGNPLKPPTS